MDTKSLSFTIFLSLFLLFTSCEKNKLSSITSIKYGTSFGFCTGYCKKDLMIDKNGLTYIKSKNGDKAAAITCTKELNAASFNSIIGNFDLNSFNSLPDVIGCPDCADGGAEYVEITSNGKTKRVTYEYGNVPKILLDVVAKLKIEFNSFKNCKS